MKSSTKKPIEHKDIFGRLIQKGDAVAAPYWNTSLGIFFVIKITPKMLRLRKIGSTLEKTAYPVDVVKVDGPEVTLYCIKYSEKRRELS
jgi:hypothetical protein